MSQSIRTVVLTLDYEVFGNGTGDVRQHITRPTEAMARACERFGAPLTVFFEVEEFLAFKRERPRLISLLGYDPAAEIENQIVELARRGHDIQLHLHPEWVGARLHEGRWLLHPDKATVDSLFNTQEEASHFIAERKAVIDELLAKAGCSSTVTAYRAGAFSAQPGKKLLSALSENGFLIDSSVVKGLFRHDAHVTLEYSNAPRDQRHWQVRDDVAVEHEAGPITEVPIYSLMGRRYQQLTPKRLLAKFSKNVPSEKRQEMIGQLKIGRTPASIVRFLLQKFPTKLDFHNMTSGQMLRWIRSAPPTPQGDLDVIVLIGHSKEHRDDAGFARFLEAVSLDPSLEIISMTELGRRLQSRQASAADSKVGRPT